EHRVRGTGLLFLVEAAGDEVLDGGEGVLLVVARHGEGDPRALGGGEQEDAEDRFAVDLLAVLANLDLGPEPAGGLDELGRGTGVQPEAVANRELPLDHGSCFSVFSATPAGAVSSASRSDAT